MVVVLVLMVVTEVVGGNCSNDIGGDNGGSGRC